MVQVYKSKIDTWLVVVLAAAIILCTVPFLLSLISGNSDELLPTLPAFVIGAGIPLWLMTTTCYTLTDSALLVKSGPFKWQIPIQEINGITPTRNPLSSPALSLDRLRIDYGRGQSIMISPKQKSEFQEHLAARRAQIG